MNILKRNASIQHSVDLLQKANMEPTGTVTNRADQIKIEPKHRTIRCCPQHCGDLASGTVFSAANTDQSPWPESFRFTLQQISDTAIALPPFSRLDYFQGHIEAAVQNIRRILRQPGKIWISFPCLQPAQITHPLYALHHNIFPFTAQSPHESPKAGHSKGNSK